MGMVTWSVTETPRVVSSRYALRIYIVTIVANKFQ